MNKKSLLLGLPLLGSLFLTGCASVFSDASYRVHIDKDYAADSFKVINNHDQSVVASGRDSKDVYLESSNSFFRPAHYSVKFYKDGQETDKRSVHATLDGATIFNVLFWPGFFIDGATGAMYKLPQAM